MRLTYMNSRTEAHAVPGRQGRRLGVGLSAGLLAVLTLAGCNVTNPGPVQDEFLNDPQSHEALVTGAERKLVEAYGNIAYTGGLTSREIFPGGQTGAGGHSPLIQGGALPYTDVNGEWDNAQQARFIAEDAIRRFTTVVDPADVDPQILAQAYVYAGYANRLLGENMCQAVFDGGAPEPNSAYFQRAEDQFTSALQTATGDLQTAAYAGRAQVRVWLGDWAGAAADAQQVPMDFAYTIETDGSTSDTRNELYWADANLPYRGYTIRFTYYDQYYANTGDPRTSWGSDPAFPYANAELSGYGPVEWTFQTKYPTDHAPYRLSSGREMMLIRAEKLLNDGSWQQALDLINQVRTSQISDKTGEPLEPVTASSATEAWTRLKRERGIELWLEARRLGDIRRWEDNNTPGDLNLADFESVADLFKQTTRARCFPIPKGEVDANPNIPSGG